MSLRATCAKNDQPTGYGFTLGPENKGFGDGVLLRIGSLWETIRIA